MVVTGAGLGGRFSAVNLPDGIRIDAEDGEIQGRAGGPVGTRMVTVSFTKNGVTVSQGFTWTITPAAPRKGGKG